LILFVLGNQENQIDFFPYQVSNSGISMTRDKIIEASADPALMRVCTSTPVKYIPDVFFKYKNKYNLMIQEAAKPTFPVEYLLITV
jgi:nuclear protein localization family protein 4